MVFNTLQRQSLISFDENVSSSTTSTTPPMNPQYSGQVTQAPIPSFPAIHGMMAGCQTNIPATQQIHPPALPPNEAIARTVVNPDMIPITSLTQYRGPPKWGVIKISNVSEDLCQINIQTAGAVS